MTDRQYPPRKAGPPGSATTYGAPRAQDPQPPPHGENEETHKPKIPVNVIQVSASAGAAVTSAVAASFFGVGGTLAGAAFGSVVSSVAGALYQESLKKAHDKVATATAVVVQRFPGDVPQAQSIHRMAGPAGVPAPDSLSRVGEEDTRRMDVEHIQLPIGEETQEMGWSGHAGHPGPSGYSGQQDVTRRMPPVAGTPVNRSYPDHGSYPDHQSYPPTRQQPAGRYPSYDRQPPPPTRRSTQRAPEPPKIWWRRPGFIMAGISMAGFLIALFAIVGTESVIGHPISGGDSGTTLTKLVSNDTTSKPTDTSTPTDSATPTGTPTPSETATASPTEGTTPTDSAAPDTTATSGPSDTSTDSATTDGDSGVQSTDQPQSTDDGSDQSDQSDQSNQGLSQQQSDGGDTGAGDQAQSTP
jgi:hypothetical protein